MKVLVTGANGQVGRALLRARPSDVEFVGLTHHELDIADDQVVAACLRQHRPGVIVNAAAYTAVDRAESEPDLAARVNAQGPANLAKMARSIGARLLQLSTDFVFDGLSSRPYQPDSAAHPLSVYGRTKLDGEHAVRALLPDRSVVLRTAWVYAPEGRNFVQTMLRLMRKNGAVRVVCDQIGSPTAARSVAEVLWRIIARNELTGTHHWSDAGVASWFDFAVAIAEEAFAVHLLPEEPTVTPIRTEEYPTPARRPAYSVLDKVSLADLGVDTVHWRKVLRSALGEIARAERSLPEQTGA